MIRIDRYDKYFLIMGLRFLIGEDDEVTAVIAVDTILHDIVVQLLP